MKSTAARIPEYEIHKTSKTMEMETETGYGNLFSNLFRKAKGAKTVEQFFTGY